MRYDDRRARTTDRDVEPHGLVNSGTRWYLVAWDRDRDDFRTFRVDRVARAASTGQRFTPRPIPGGDLGTYVSQSVASNAYPFRARVILHAPLEEMAQRVSPLTGRLERVDADRCLMECGGGRLDLLGLHIALLGVEFEVLDPPELREHMRALAERMARAAAGPGS